MNHSEPVAREGWIFVVLAVLLTLLLYFTAGYGGAVPGVVLTVFCLFFFRNPGRTIPEERGIVVSPADGKVMDITTMAEDKYIQANTQRVRIFLSLFNVHINRNPIAGKVEWVKKVSGEYLPAYKDEASFKNARNYLGISTAWGRIMVVQITGLIARRLVCWVRPGDIMSTGERFGLIRFGSCTEIYLPDEAVIKVKPGQKVKGGETIIARFHE
ncbi:MAG: phosphatidylserine decarboxylase family protein [Syntrophomonadaceae bacterium]|nr:phosphatidylserine decarboxylase family protein [Syntrophomonadaceae bacterium]